MIDANHIRQVVAARYNHKRWATHFEIGLLKGGRLRADVVALNMGGGIDIVEVKSSVADFRSDKKMGQYRKYCDKMYLACTKEVYDKIKDQILPGVGVYVVGQDSIYVAKRAKYEGMHGKTRLSLAVRLGYRSADQTLHQRKSKTAGRHYVINKILDVVQSTPKPRSRKSIFAAVDAALKGML